MKIAICDDQIEVVKNLKNLIEECMNGEQQEYEIQYFLFANELLRNIAGFNVVFLDTTMPEMDGIEIGKVIQKINPYCKIIIETEYVDRVKEWFKIGTFRFITKPFNKEEIREALRALLDLQLKSKFINLFKNRNKYMVLQKNIQYILAYNGYAEFFVNGRTYRKDITLKNLEQCLDSRMFIRATRKYIVNMFWISEYKQGIIIIGNEKIKVARRNKKDFERTYMEFDIKYRQRVNKNC